jgi:hypothetical protein
MESKDLNSTVIGTSGDFPKSLHQTMSPEDMNKALEKDKIIPGIIICDPGICETTTKDDPITGDRHKSADQFPLNEDRNKSADRFSLTEDPSKTGGKKWDDPFKKEGESELDPLERYEREQRRHKLEQAFPEIFKPKKLDWY